jgi:4-hydroxyacetophenone monooxygenase
MQLTDSTPTQLADDAILRQHIGGADIPTLLITTAHLTSDYALLKDEWRPEIEFGAAVSGMSAETEAEVRELCLKRLGHFRDSGAPLPPTPTFDEVHRISTWVMGTPIEPFVPLVYEEVVVDDFDQRRPTWHKDDLAPEREFSVAIIGAGESGLLTALRLQQAGVPFTIYEKNAEVGGTWYENNYPGCRVDCNSFFYSFACARGDWPDYYAKSTDVLDYLKSFALEHGLYEHIQLNTEVTSCRWQDDGDHWELTVSSPEGERVHRSELLVSAVGQLNRPSLPDIPGQERFEGPSFHTARWDHSVDTDGKCVGVIGTGATALQVIPQLAENAAHVKIFARTTPWLLPTPLLHEKVSSDTTWLLQNLPLYSLWYRVTLAIPGAFGMLDGVIVDPAYPPTEKAVSAVNEAVRATLTAWLEDQFADRPELREFVIPDSPVGGKRIVRDNGAWIETLKKKNVEIIKQRIEEVTSKGLACADGSEHECDVIVYGTGFRAAEFLMPMEVKGRHGADLHELWDTDDARAFLGSTVPQFPNLFMMYGPNTNQVVHGGSAVLWSEFAVTYTLDAVRLLLSSGAGALEVTERAYTRYNERVDAASLHRAWGFSKVSSWYKNSKGRVSQNYPFSSAELWQRTNKVALTDYHVTPARAGRA